MAGKIIQSQAKIKRRPELVCAPLYSLLALSTSWNTHGRACWEARWFCKGQTINSESKGHSGSQWVCWEGGLGGAQHPILPSSWSPAGSAGAGGIKCLRCQPVNLAFPSLYSSPEGWVRDTQGALSSRREGGAKGWPAKSIVI